jgi:DNA polymerase-4
VARFCPQVGQPASLSPAWPCLATRTVESGGMSLLPTIVHLDADAFFVAVEQVRRPELRGTKCAVGGRERGIISSASYEARACGVYTPMPTVSALRVCPDLIMIPHTPGVYSEASRRMFDLCETLTPVVQRNSIDEGYLDVGPCGFRTPAEVEAAVRDLQARILRELGLPVSMGLAANRLTAQIASKLRKPRGFIVVPPGTEAAFLAPLGVGKLPGIGTKTEALLVAAGVRTVRDLLDAPDARLRPILGSGVVECREMASGRDDRPVETGHEDAKSYGQQQTFGTNLSDFAEVERIAKGMVDDLLPAIRQDGKRVRTLTVRVRYSDFSQETHGRSLAEATDLEHPFYPLVGDLLRAAWRKRQPLRLVGVKFSGVEEKPAQLEMFAEPDEKRRRLAGVVDALNGRRDGPAVRPAVQLRPADPAGIKDAADLITRRPR